MLNNLLIKKELILFCRDYNGLNAIIQDNHSFFDNAEILMDGCIKVKTSLSEDEIKELDTTLKIHIFKCGDEEKQDIPTIDEVLDKINKSGILSLNYNDKIILYSYGS